jgi:hypothetical protein
MVRLLTVFSYSVHYFPLVCVSYFVSDSRFPGLTGFDIFSFTVIVLDVKIIGANQLIIKDLSSIILDFFSRQVIDSKR